MPAPTPPAATRRTLDQLAALAHLAQAQARDAQAARRHQPFSPSAHARVLMLRAIVELLAALLAVLAAAPRPQAAPSNPILPARRPRRAACPRRTLACSSAGAARPPRRAGAAPNPNPVLRAHAPA